MVLVKLERKMLGEEFLCRGSYDFVFHHHVIGPRISLNPTFLPMLLTLCRNSAFYFSCCAQ